jgi:hypothetical protein
MGCSGNIRPAMVRMKIISIGLFLEAITKKKLDEVDEGSECVISEMRAQICFVQGCAQTRVAPIISRPDIPRSFNSRKENTTTALNVDTHHTITR